MICVFLLHRVLGTHSIYKLENANRRTTTSTFNIHVLLRYLPHFPAVNLGDRGLRYAVLPLPGLLLAFASDIE